MAEGLVGRGKGYEYIGFARRGGKKGFPPAMALGKCLGDASDGPDGIGANVSALILEAADEALKTMAETNMLTERA